MGATHCQFCNQRSGPSITCYGAQPDKTVWKYFRIGKKDKNGEIRFSIRHSTAKEDDAKLWYRYGVPHFLNVFGFISNALKPVSNPFRRSKEHERRMNDAHLIKLTRI